MSLSFVAPVCAARSDGAEKVPNGRGWPFFGGYKMFIPSLAIVCRGAKRVCFFLRPVRRDFFSTVNSCVPHSHSPESRPQAVDTIWGIICDFLALTTAPRAVRYSCERRPFEIGTLL